MTDRTCSIDGCQRRIKARGWCNAHYLRWWETGSPTGSTRIDPLDRMLNRCMESAGGCWMWRGSTNNNGYAVSSAPPRRDVYVHRYVYERMVGAIPDGLVLDHLCRNRACVNPWHLQPVTQKVNILRGVSPMALHANASRCIRGHEWDEANTYIRPDSGARQCRECRRLNQRRRTDGREA